jgi:hypothetical protein
MTETARLARLAELEPDIRNANLHTQRGTHLVSRSLEKLGAGRSILLDKHNRIIAGNLTTEQYAAMGGEEVQIIDSDGKTLIAVRRNDMDLDDPETGAREMAYADNRAAVVSIDFDAEQIAADVGAGIDLRDWWHDWELEAMQATDPDDPNALWEGMPEFEQEDKTSYRAIKVHFATPEDVTDFAELIGQPLTEKTIYIWYPKMVRENLKALTYTDES